MIRQLFINQLIRATPWSRACDPTQPLLKPCLWCLC